MMKGLCIMKQLIAGALLVAAFGFPSHVQAQFMDSKLAWGLAAGGVHGGNSQADRWDFQFRGTLQFDISPTFVGEVGLGYAKLRATDVYSVQSGLADVRLLFSPFSLPNLNPYLYAGFGVSKALNTDGSSLLAMVPLGVGIQTSISDGIFMSVNGGYTLSLSDQLDGRERPDTDLNPLTSGKHDGFYGFTVGLSFTLGSSYLAEAEREKELQRAEALRAQQIADAAAESQRVKQLTDAEARRVKELNDAEALRIKEGTDAEARRVKELADAEARRLAEQKDKNGNSTIIILERGKKVVLKGVNFETNKATLTSDSREILTIAYNAMVANPDVQVEISGHTDNVGSQESNQILSLKRAQAVKNWLVQNGITSNRMKTVGKGENEPMTSNVSISGRAENRRIEFYVEQ